jgi:TetR/AcrR family tetracycline transcriptional repressor
MSSKYFYSVKEKRVMALNKDRIIEEALRLLNESGLEGVTLRKLATKLEVQAPALYWHFKNKAMLVGGMAEAILQEQLSDIPSWGEGDPWGEWLIQLIQRLRIAMLVYKDGARVVAGAHLSPTMARINETILRTLCEAGVTLRDSRLLLLTVTHYTFGYVIEEQTPPPPEGIAQFDLVQFKKDHPTTIAGIEEYFGAGRTVDDLFLDGLTLIIESRERR